MFNKKYNSKSISWQFANYVCSFALNFVIQISLARLIDPEDFGTLAIINTIVAFADIFVQSGISIAIIQKKHLNPCDIFTAQIISGATACAFAVIIVIVAPVVANIYNMPGLVIPLQVLSISLIFNSINSIFSSLLVRRMAYKKLFFRTVGVVPVAGLIGIIFAYFQLGIWALVIYQIVMNVLNCFVYIFACEDKIEFKYSKKGAKEMYRFGIKILLTGLINNLYDTVRTLIIGGKFSRFDLAYYDRALTYSKYTVQIAHSMISSVALPIFSQKQDSLDRLKLTSRKIVGLSAFVMFPVLLGAAGVSRPLIIILLTDKWKETIPYFIIFCFLRLLGVITIIDKQMFYSIGRSDLILKYSIVSLLLNITTLLFIFPFGVMAIAVNTLIVEVVISFIIALMSSKVLNYRLKEKFLDIYKPFVNSLIMFVIILLIDNYIALNVIVLLFVQVSAGVTCYFMLAVLTKDSNLFWIKGKILSKFRRK